MKDKIIAEISSKLKEIYPDGTIYLDSVMQSTNLKEDNFLLINTILLNLTYILKTDLSLSQPVE